MYNLSPKLLLVLSITTILLIASCKHESDLVPIDNTNNPEDSNIIEITCSPDTTYFQNDIMPILSTSCAYADCHDSYDPQEGIDLTTYQNIMASGTIVPGDASESELYEAITEDDPEDRMPYGLPPLSSQQVAAIRDWINQGAKNNSCQAECDTTIFTYSGAVQMILAKSCVNCHKSGAASGGILLDNHTSVAEVASSGRLIGAITHKPGYTAMPYSSNPANQRKLENCEITIIQKWVNAGNPNN
jgi:hypothetical protein